jgi:hypothetical protein
MTTDSNGIYPDLTKVISFEGFSFANQTYAEQELKILQPRLEALGYTKIIWMMGESDSFGPLTRLCSTIDPLGYPITFFYG